MAASGDKAMVVEKREQQKSDREPKAEAS